MSGYNDSSRVFTHPHRFRYWLTVVLDVLIALMSIGGWLYMFLGSGVSGILSGAGLRSLRYYTVLSNLFAGLVSLWCLPEDLHRALSTGAVYERAARSAAIPGDTSAALIESGALGGVLSASRSGRPAARRKPALRIIASATVTVTLAVVLGFLGPIFGYSSLFAGANLYLHLLSPLAAILNCIVSRAGSRTYRRAALYAMIPTFLYAAFYLANILLNGVGEWPDTNDWYGFTMFGWGFVPVIFGAIVGATGLFALLLYMLGGGRLSRDRI